MKNIFFALLLCIVSCTANETADSKGKAAALHDDSDTSVSLEKGLKQGEIQSLAEVKKIYPFKEWRAKYKEGFEQFTAANCKKATEIADALVDGLVSLKGGTELQKLDLFKTAVLAYNQLNDATDGTLLETEEREELVWLINAISSLVGLDPKSYNGGEGVAAEWRDW